MAVRTRVPIALLTFPVAAHYSTFNRAVQGTFDKHMEDADAATNDGSYYMAMIRAAQTFGIAIPATYDIALCDCLNNGCGCDLVFDSHLPGVVVTANADPGFNLSRLQCPDCAHDHGRPIED
ncbi:hypothetical protein [Streptomyces sp. NBC_00847]|uniref:hypothetical protein n=1 Tax=Streptomyces sp. NBC_00847 TaxID=2975850 RepID=UPI00225E323A|nr:hypothetical protein [Streptomyces sp. NBC_00847]MCX4885942.1 hypothetical protein [Streptomyces sp. NBC_00847]